MFGSELRALEPKTLHELADAGALQGMLDVARERPTGLGRFSDRTAYALGELTLGFGPRRVALGPVLGVERRLARFALLLGFLIELAPLLLGALFHGLVPRIDRPRLLGTLVSLTPELACELLSRNDGSRRRAPIGYLLLGCSRINRLPIQTRALVDDATPNGSVEE